MATWTRTLTRPDGQGFRFDPGSFAMELLVSGGPGELRVFEELHAPDDLAAWLADSRLTATAPFTAADVRVTEAELHAVKELRDAFWGVARALAHGDDLPPVGVDALNAATAETPRPVVDPVTRALTWAKPITGTQVLGAAARDAVELVARGGVRECSASNCGLLFVDTSRSGNRRWCSMERCGNRHKVRAHRARHETEPADAQ
ncbi:putative RNA-binding Zn ribbon-like protein [Saccharothrix saharensis]|uniref:Putative RNA-binding Zn ribbon-like protein n=1 Tax=Saccharothrix saharensis TaxID=571190 RepID=A0A543JFK7_9PSEU|nr:CGNR zinc finger domain-containing protein [Saccharothrix saharensis]TQM81574.1 putative RNA-binding Zn ribbon-like protein [Saccharothrix saharensis]